MSIVIFFLCPLLPLLFIFHMLCFFPYLFLPHSLMHHSILCPFLHNYMCVILLLHSLLCLSPSLVFVLKGLDHFVCLFAQTFSVPIYKENLIINCLTQIHSLCTDCLIASTSGSFSLFDQYVYFENNYFLLDLPPQLLASVGFQGFALFQSIFPISCASISFI